MKNLEVDFTHSVDVVEPPSSEELVKELFGTGAMVAAAQGVIEQLAGGEVTMTEVPVFEEGEISGSNFIFGEEYSGIEFAPELPEMKDKKNPPKPKGGHYGNGKRRGLSQKKAGNPKPGWVTGGNVR